MTRRRRRRRRMRRRRSRRRMMRRRRRRRRRRRHTNYNVMILVHVQTSVGPYVHPFCIRSAAHTLCVFSANLSTSERRGVSKCPWRRRGLGL